jgi:hypothetical protein
MGLNLMKNVAARNLREEHEETCLTSSVSEIFLKNISTLRTILGHAPSC